MKKLPTYDRVQLAKFCIGAVVEVLSIPRTAWDIEVIDIGHVDGFAINSLGQLLVLIKNANLMITPYLPDRLKPLS